MAQLDIPTHLAPGVTIANKDDKITITIMTKPPSDDIAIGWDTRALWYAAYARLREKHAEELERFEWQACIAFRLVDCSFIAKALGHCTTTADLHNLSPDTVLGAVHRWISEAKSEKDDEEEEDEVRRALTSTMTTLSRNMQESPSAHLAWVAASLCIQKLVKDTKPTCEAPGLAYIVAQIAFYDRLPQLVTKAPGDDEQGPNDLREVLIDLYSAILKQLIVHPNVGVDSAILHPIIALELSLGFHARDKALEESIAELVRLRAPSPAISGSDDRDACEAANDTMKAEDDGGSNDDGDPDDNDYSHLAHRDANTADAAADHNRGNRSRARKIQKLLCVVPVKPPPLLPPSQLSFVELQSVFGGLRRWALEQDAYQRWRKARSADHGDSNDRILWLHGPEDSSMAMMLHALAQAETENQAGESDPEWPPYAVACASWDWSRDVNGMSVMSVLRDLVWMVLTTQPTLQKHLAKAVQATGRRPLLGGDGNHSQAQYAALGTSCDFYAMLALLCSIVGDPAFAPTCFVIDYKDMLWVDDDDDDDEADGDESCKKGRGGPAGTAQKRAWTLRDLMALVCTTCRLSRNVTWIVRSMSWLPPSASIGGCHVYSPEGPVLGEIMHDYIRALLQKRADANYTPDIRKQLASELTGRAGGNVAWSTLAVDLVVRARLPWNAVRILQRLPDSSAGLGPLLDCIVRSNVGDSDTDGDRALVDAALHTAALAFQPLTVPELAALAGLPATVDAAIFFHVLVGPLLELRDVSNASGEAQKYVYFPSRAVLAAQRARLVKATAAPDLHADMVRRHLRQLARHYSDSGRRGQLSVYMKIAWLRHLGHVGIGIGRTDDLPVTDSLAAEVRDFVAQNASAWLHDLDALGILDVIGRMLQDLLPSPRELGRLSPTQAALNTLFTRILRSWEMGMSVTNCDRFMHIAGCGQNGDDGELPVLPQVPPMLPPLDSSTTAFIGTLESVTDMVHDTHWAYDDRLIVSVSDDYELRCWLRCWDRASCRIQHVAYHKTLPLSKTLALSPTHPSLIVVGDIRGISTFDLAVGGVHVKRISFSEIMARQRNEDAAHEFDPLFTVHFAVDGSVIVTGCLYELVLGMPGLDLKEVRRIAVVAYRSLPTVIEDALPVCKCKDFSVADNVELAAVVHNDGNLLIYNTNLAERQQTIHWAQSKFARVQYDSNIRAFATWDERNHVMLHLVHETGGQFQQQVQGEQGEHGERQPTKPSYRPLIRSYKLPHQYPDIPTSFIVSSDRDEISLTFTYTNSCQIYKLIEADTDACRNAACVDDTPDISSPGNEPAHASVPFMSTLFSHDGLRAATSSRSGLVQLWSRPNMATSEREASDASDARSWRTMSLSADSKAHWLCFSSDDTQLLACYNNGKTVVWDTETCERVAVMGERGHRVKFANFSPTDALVASVPYDDGPIRLWDLKACQQSYQDTHRIGDDGNDGDKTTPIMEQTFVALNDAAIEKDYLVHIWDISPDSASNTILPSRALMPCATLHWNDTATQNPEKDSQEGKNRGGEEEEDDDNGGNKGEDDDDDDDDDDVFYGDDDDDDDDDDDVYQDSEGLKYSSFVFSPDSRSLFGFHKDGRLFVWKRTPDPPSSSLSSPPSSDNWQPRATVLADGFAIPGQDRLWVYKPRRLSISEDIDGRYLLHTEIGVWELPSLPGDAKVGLRPSMRYPCSVVDTGAHRAILWQNRLLTKLPLLYEPFCQFFFQGLRLTCDVHTVDGSTSSLIIGTGAGHLLWFRFRGKETNTNGRDGLIMIQGK